MIDDAMLDRIIACDNIAAYSTCTRELAREVRELRRQVGIVYRELTAQSFERWRQTPPPPTGRDPWPHDPGAPRVGGWPP